MKRRWGQASVSTIVPIQDHSCRVCGAATKRGEPALFKSWGVEYAHPACGWETEAEKAEAAEKARAS